MDKMIKKVLKKEKAAVKETKQLLKADIKHDKVVAKAKKLVKKGK